MKKLKKEDESTIAAASKAFVISNFVITFIFSINLANLLEYD